MLDKNSSIINGPSPVEYRTKSMSVAESKLSNVCGAVHFHGLHFYLILHCNGHVVLIAEDCELYGVGSGGKGGEELLGEDYFKILC